MGLTGHNCKLQIPVLPPAENYGSQPDSPSGPGVPPGTRSLVPLESAWGVRSQRGESDQILRRCADASHGPDVT